MHLKQMVYCLKNKLNYSVIFMLLFVFFGCKKAEDKTVKKVENEELVMYQYSEMALFMEAMYAYNKQIREGIIAGKVPEKMPLDLLKLHSAKMTEGKHRTKVWNSFVNLFIESQKAVADTLSNTNLKLRYNTAINNCLNCHKTECVGPIPRIKKLLIN